MDLLSCKFTLCGKSFSCTADLELHALSHGSRNTFQCDLCGKSYKYKKGLTAHANIHGGKKHKCEICGKSFSAKSTLKQHTIVHGIRKKFFKCDLCNKNFLSRLSLTAHVKRHERAFKCDLCGKSFPDLSTVTDHVKKHVTHGSFVCSICGLRWWDDLQLKRHRYSHTEDKPFKCDICGKSFLDKYTLNLHAKVHVVGKSFICTFCDQAFWRPSKLRLHMLSHTKEFKCLTCGKCYMNKKNLTRHILIRHKKEYIKKYECSICGKRFRSPGDLRTHGYGHTNEKPFKCDKCESCFIYKAGLDRHTKVNTCRTTSTAFRCKICKKSLGIKRYLSIDHGQYICKVCEEPFCLMLSLKKHMLIHTGDEMGQCPICKKQVFKGNINKHIQTMHKQGRSKDLNCRLCKKSFKYGSGLQKHILQVHKKTGSWEACTHCDKEFYKLDVFQNHCIDNTNVSKDSCVYLVGDISLKTEDEVTVNVESGGNTVKQVGKPTESLNSSLVRENDSVYEKMEAVDGND